METENESDKNAENAAKKIWEIWQKEIKENQKKTDETIYYSEI